jgi:rhamnosyltransferase
MTNGAPERLASGKEVCAVLVTYHPDTGFPARVSRVLPQVGALITVDNGSGEAALAMLQTLSADRGTILVANPQNLGVASALNIGIAEARARGFGWALFLDQDSCVDSDMLETLIAVRASFPDPGRLAVIGAGFRDVHRDSAAASAGGDGDGDEPWEEVESVITSGSLISLAVHALIGPFREEFFIDYVDTDYCFRARAKGYRVIKTRQPLMAHAIGASTQHDVLWMEKWTTNHSPDRRYYIARNDTVMLREYGDYAFGLWALKSFARRVRTCKRVLLYEQMKTRKIVAVAQGWWDGVRGRLGPRTA